MNHYALAYREQQQLFMFDKTYLWGTLLKVGGLATLLARFIVQFFWNPRPQARLQHLDPYGLPGLPLQGQQERRSRQHTPSSEHRASQLHKDKQIPQNQGYK